MNEKDFLLFEMISLVTGIIYFFVSSFLFIIYNIFNFENILLLFLGFIIFFVIGMNFHFKRNLLVKEMLELIEKVKSKPDIRIINPSIRKYRSYDDFKYKTFEVYVTEKEVVVRGILKKTNSFSPYISIYMR